MGIPTEIRNTLVQRRDSPFLIASPAEEEKIRNARSCTQEGVRAGTKAAAITCVATAVPTAVDLNLLLTPYVTDLFVGDGWVSGKMHFVLCKLAAVRVIPWAKANLNYTAQALIISSASIAAYFITADKTILECARKNARYEKTA